MEIVILGSGGCTVIPKPLCRCRVCAEAREKGRPCERTGPAAYLYDERLLIDTPADIIRQLNRESIEAVDYLMLTHLDPDHIEGLRVVEQIALDFRTWEACPEKRICLVAPRRMLEGLDALRTGYGSPVAFYEQQGFLRIKAFDGGADIGALRVDAIPVEREGRTAYIYVFRKHGRKIVYAPCDIKPFPEDNYLARDPDLLVIQPGMFESGLRHDFTYPPDHVSRSTLYTFEETIALSRRIHASRVLFVHIEEYWNRSPDEYLELEDIFDNITFAVDGMRVTI